MKKIFLVILAVIGFWSSPCVDGFAIADVPENAQTFISPSLGAKFVLIQAGTFMMGSTKADQYWESDEMPRHEVTISRSFYMQTTEVTQGQWRKVMGSNPSVFADCGDNCPVENVSWNDVQAFIDKLNRMEKTEKYRLPTEAEWEYAARAGTTTMYYAGDKVLDGVRAAWHTINGGGGTHTVGTKIPNAWGLYDVLGNVWEWVKDWKGDYSSDSVTDPKGPSSGSERVYRGGCFDSYTSGVRAANRLSGKPDVRNSSVGFRLVRGL
jgi:formylglycine-generating enzyme required for sulfatase activity